MSLGPPTCRKKSIISPVLVGPGPSKVAPGPQVSLVLAPFPASGMTVASTVPKSMSGSGQ